ncbi:MAG: SUF system Fe-S cluster assembly protein [Planctomycetes bacterium]|nr:SUF system Fe-S cluster assembly protein [Planctomycetota bacterium]MCW8136312.1 SUF system Fe-S cluster assembly protein [Planctomycetota bacterium]
MTNETEKHQPEGAAKLVDPEKVKPLPPVEVDSTLQARGAPGQGAGARSTSEAASGKAAADRSKLPKDAEGNPRDLTVAEAKAAKEAVIEKLKTVYDPEIPVNVYELGLIYGVSVNFKGEVHVRMTLTSPACPVAGTLPGEVESKLKQVEHVTDAKVELVWDPPWTKSMMSEAAKLELNVM